MNKTRFFLLLSLGLNIFLIAFILGRISAFFSLIPPPPELQSFFEGVREGHMPPPHHPPHADIPEDFKEPQPAAAVPQVIDRDETTPRLPLAEDMDNHAPALQQPAETETEAEAETGTELETEPKIEEEAEPAPSPGQQ